MAKHYKQNRKDREDESRGMKRYERRHQDRMDRRDESRGRRDDDRHHSDALMMPRDMAEAEGNETQLYHEGKRYYGPGYGHIANMPPYADLGMYPKERKYLKTNDYPDTLGEIDKDNDFNYGQVEKHRSKSMY